MLLALRSGIHTEMDWALDRLCRLCDNEAWHLSSIPGLIDTLFDMPERFVRVRSAAPPTIPLPLFRPADTDEALQRHALNCLLALRNSTLNPPNAQALSAHKRTRPLIYSALQHLDPSRSADSEFLLYVLEMFYIIHSGQMQLLSFTSDEPNPIDAIAHHAGTSSDRALIVASLSALSLIFSEPGNYKYLRVDTPALNAVVRYLPAFAIGDRGLSEACLNYLSIYLAHPPAAKAFMRRPELPATLRVLASIVLAHQKTTLEEVKLGGSSPSPLSRTPPELYKLQSSEITRLSTMMEPERSQEWYALIHSLYICTYVQTY
jgi:chromatin structure-remodeling complex subunit RSC9